MNSIDIANLFIIGENIEIPTTGQTISIWSFNRKILVNKNTILEQLDREIFHQIRISPTMYDLVKTSITCLRR